MPFLPNFQMNQLFINSQIIKDELALLPQAASTQQQELCSLINTNYIPNRQATRCTN